MPNRVRGEAELVAGGRGYRLLLTLGALAEIEDGLNLADLSQVAARLKTVRAADLAIVAAALLRGGGHDVAPADVLRLPCDLGALVAAVTAAFDAAGL
ncbi:MAG TPA: GTA-gp10 family protein, partial [Rhizomicrobium sp.]